MILYYKRLLTILKYYLKSTHASIQYLLGVVERPMSHSRNGPLLLPYLVFRFIRSTCSGTEFDVLQTAVYPLTTVSSGSVLGIDLDHT